MMQTKVKTMNIDDQYLSIAKLILDEGINKEDRTGTGTKSIFSAQVVHNMSEGFPLLTTKKMYWKGIVTELLWFLRGDTNIKYLVDNDCHIWDGDAYKSYKVWADDLSKTHMYLPYTKEQFIEKIKTDDEFAKKWGELGPVYGKQWRDWGGYFSNGHWNGQNNSTGLHIGGVDQIQNLIDSLKTNPDSRRLMVNAWNVGELDHMTLPPCHWAFELYTEETDLGKRRLSLKWHQRSVDLPLGLPFNIASYALLLEILAKEVNMIPGTLIGDLTNVHIYNDQIVGILEQLNANPYKYDYPNLVIGDNATWGNDFLVSDFQLIGYNSYPKIKIPLSN